VIAQKLQRAAPERAFMFGKDHAGDLGGRHRVRLS
jgi:hypothetical protein